jgi:hypothetical protein
MQAGKLVTYGIAAAAVALTVAAGVFAYLADDPADTVYVIVTAVLGLTSVALGVLVARRRPASAVGALLAWVGLLPITMSATDVYAEAVAERPGVVPVSALLVALHGGDWMFLYVPPALLALTFPDGHAPGPRWRWVGVGLIAVPVVFMALVAFDPAPFPPPFTDVPHVLSAGPLAPVLEVAALALLPVFLGLLVATAASMVARYRHEPDPVRRAQVKWFALGALFIPATLVLCWAGYLFLDGPDLVIIGLVATYLAIPAATTIAVLRHDLYDVDRALSATVTYGIVTTALLAFYTAATFLAGVALGREPPPPPCAPPPSRRCAPGCSAGWTGGSIRPGGRRWPRSRTCGGAPTTGRRSRNSCRPNCGPRCATRTCGSATDCRARRVWSTRRVHRCRVRGRRCCSAVRTSAS